MVPDGVIWLEERSLECMGEYTEERERKRMGKFLAIDWKMKDLEGIRDVLIQIDSEWVNDLVSLTKGSPRSSSFHPTGE